MPSSLLPIPINQHVSLRAPARMCCNCGSVDHVEIVPTDLRWMPGYGLAEHEIRVILPFPYCAGCVPSARRRRPTVMGIAALATLYSLVLGMGWIFYGPQLSEEAATFAVAPGLVAISLAGLFAYYARHRRSGTQTCVYQPVRLVKTSHGWPQDASRIELRFTNRTYAALFADANQELILAGTMKVLGV